MHSGWWNDWICRGQSGTTLRQNLNIRNVPSFLSQSSMKLRSSGAVYSSLVPFIKLLYTTCVVVVWQLNSPLSMEVDWKSQLQRSLMAAVRAVLTAMSALVPSSWRYGQIYMQRMLGAVFAYWILKGMAKYNECINCWGKLRSIGQDIFIYICINRDGEWLEGVV